VVCSVDKFYMAQVSKQSHTQTMQAKDIKDNSTQDKMGREAYHCFLQESDSVCTTVLTVKKNCASCGFWTLSENKTALRAVFWLHCLPKILERSRNKTIKQMCLI